MRALAILGVLLSHGHDILAPDCHLAFLRFFGNYGVTLFFVLSGFLIGSIFIKTAQNGLNRASLTQFWLKRWLRTLPAYYAVLLFVFALHQQIDWEYLLFLQGVVGRDFSLMPVSWSLVIEEWFYLALPLLCLLMRPWQGVEAVQRTAIALFIISLIGRIGLYFYAADAALLSELSGYSPLHFEAISLGAYLACLDAKRNLKAHMPLPSLWLWLAAAVSFVCVFTYGSLTRAAIIDLPLWVHYILIPSVAAASAGLVLLCLYCSPPKTPALLARPIYWISVTSYSNYLWHLLVKDGMAQWLHHAPIVNFAAYISISFVIAIAMYLAIEKPFLTLRDKLLRRR